MKKITLFLCLLIFGLSSAQIHFSDDFQDGDANGWTLVDDDGDGNNWAVGDWSNVGASVPEFDSSLVSRSWDGNNGLYPDNFAISSPIDLSSATTTNFQLSYSFGTAQATTYFAEHYAVYITTSNVVADIKNATPLVDETLTQGGRQVKTITLDNSLIGQTVYLTFRHYNTFDMNTMIVDDVIIQNVLPLDVKMNNISTANIQQLGNVTVSGEIENLGTATITSVDLNWQVDGGTIYTQNVSGLSIATNQTYTFNHSDLWNVTSTGDKNLRVWVSNPNGTGADGDTSNDELVKTISVPTGSTAMRSLYEGFSSSTCGPCATYNNSYFNTAYINTNNTVMEFIKYQVSWPGAGDPYATAETAIRVGYYGVSGAPTMYLNGGEEGNWNQAIMQTNLNNANSQDSYFTISGVHSFDGNTINVNVTTTPFVSGNYTVHVVVVENETTANTGTNGETSFKHVMMKMMPNATGTSVNFTSGVPNVINLSTDMSTTFVEDINDLSVIYFVQDNDTKSIMQSARSTEVALGVDEDVFSNVRFYPNPSNGQLYFNTPSPLNINIVDLYGKQVFTKSEVQNTDSIDLSHLSTGIYLVSMTLDGQKSVQKLVVQ